MANKTAARQGRINLRIDLDLYTAAVERARAYGGLSAVIRTLLRQFVDGKLTLKREDVLDELLPIQTDAPAKRKPAK